MTTEHEKEIESFGANNDFWIFGYGYVNHCGEEQTEKITPPPLPPPVPLHSLPSLTYIHTSVCVCLGCICVCMHVTCLHVQLVFFYVCVTWANSLGALFFRLK